MRKLAAALAFLACILTPAWGQESQGFQPCAAFTFSVTNSTANQQLSSCAGVLQLINSTTTEVFYNIGNSAVSATASAATTGANTSYSLPASTTVFVVVNALPGIPAPYIAMIAGVAGPTVIRINQGWRNG